MRVFIAPYPLDCFEGDAGHDRDISVLIRQRERIKARGEGGEVGVDDMNAAPPQVATCMQPSDGRAEDAVRVIAVRIDEKRSVASLHVLSPEMFEKVRLAAAC